MRPVIIFATFIIPFLLCADAQASSSLSSLSCATTSATYDHVVACSLACKASSGLPVTCTSADFQFICNRPQCGFPSFSSLGSVISFQVHVPPLAPFTNLSVIVFPSSTPNQNVVGSPFFMNVTQPMCACGSSNCLFQYVPFNQVFGIDYMNYGPNMQCNLELIGAMRYNFTLLSFSSSPGDFLNISYLAVSSVGTATSVQIASFSGSQIKTPLTLAIIQSNVHVIWSTANSHNYTNGWQAMITFPDVPMGASILSCPNTTIAYGTILQCLITCLDGSGAPVVCSPSEFNVYLSPSASAGYLSLVTAPDQTHIIVSLDTSTTLASRITSTSIYASSTWAPSLQQSPQTIQFYNSNPNFTSTAPFYSTFLPQNGMTGIPMYLYGSGFTLENTRQGLCVFSLQNAAVPTYNTSSVTFIDSTHVVCAVPELSGIIPTNYYSNTFLVLYSFDGTIENAIQPFNVRTFLFHMPTITWVSVTSVTSNYAITIHGMDLWQPETQGANQTLACIFTDINNATSRFIFSATYSSCQGAMQAACNFPTLPVPQSSNATFSIAISYYGGLAPIRRWYQGYVPQTVTYFQPLITSMPQSVLPGTYMLISGSGFFNPPYPMQISVLFLPYNSIQTATFIDSGQISVTVPQQLAPGNAEINLSFDSGQSNVAFANFKIANPNVASSCGDGKCTGTDTCLNCPQDCGPCSEACKSHANGCCPAGMSGTLGSPPCQICLPGTFSLTRGSTACQKAPIGYYSVGNMSTAQIACASGSTTMSDGSTSVDFCIPQAGYWRDPTNTNFFFECIPSDACPGGVNQQCIPNADGSYPPVCDIPCANGYTGRICGDCTDGYYRLNLSCNKCPNNQGILITLFVGVVLVCVFLLRKLAQLREAFGSISIGINSLQISALFPSFQVPWPPALLKLLNYFSYLSFDLQLTNPECSASFLRDYETKWSLWMLFPVFAFCLALVAICFIVGRNKLAQKYGHAVQEKFATKEEEEEEENSQNGEVQLKHLNSSGLDESLLDNQMNNDEEKEIAQDCDTNDSVTIEPETQQEFEDPSNSHSNKRPKSSLKYDILRFFSQVKTREHLVLDCLEVLGIFCLFLSLAYTFLASKAIEPLDCTKQADGSYSLDARPSIQCWVPSSRALQSKAIVATVFYVIGVPSLFVGVIFYHRRELYKPRAQSIMGFLVNRYHPKWVLWDLAVILRKLLVIFSRTFFTTVPLFSVTLGLLSLFLASVAHAFAQPFLTKTENWLEILLLFCNFTTLFSGLLFLSDKFPTPSSIDITTGVVIFVAIVQVLMILGFSAKSGWDAWSLLRKMQMEERDWRGKLKQTASKYFTPDSFPHVEAWLDSARSVDLVMLEKQFKRMERLKEMDTTSIWSEEAKEIIVKSALVSPMSHVTRLRRFNTVLAQADRNLRPQGATSPDLFVIE